MDERVFATLRQLRQSHPESRRISLAQFKEIVREQFLLLRYDEERAVAAIPRLLPDDQAGREQVLDAVRRAAEAAGDLSAEAKLRLSRIETLFADSGPGPRTDDSDKLGTDGAPRTARKLLSVQGGPVDTPDSTKPQAGAAQPRPLRRGAGE